MQLVGFVFRAEIDDRPLADRHSEPWPAQHVCDCARQFEQRLADGTVSRCEMRLTHGDAIIDRPLALGRRVSIPARHIDIGKRFDRPRRRTVWFGARRQDSKLSGSKIRVIRIH